MRGRIVKELNVVRLPTRKNGAVGFQRVRAETELKKAPIHQAAGEFPLSGEG